MRHWSFITAFIVAILAGSPVSAHPHVFIDAKAEFRFDRDGSLAALHISWTYDAFSSLTLIEALDLDKDNDGVLDAGDLARLVTAQTVWPDDFIGDTYLEQSGRPIALGRPKNGMAAMEDMRISVSFDLELQAPLGTANDVTLRLYDPQYYYAYATNDANSNGPCRVHVTAFQSNAAQTEVQLELSKLSQEEVPEQADVGRLFADVIRLECT